MTKQTLNLCAILFTVFTFRYSLKQLSNNTFYKIMFLIDANRLQTMVIGLWNVLVAHQVIVQVCIDLCILCPTA